MLFVQDQITFGKKNRKTQTKTFFVLFKRNVWSYFFFNFFLKKNNTSNIYINGFHATIETYATTMKEGGHEFEYWNKEDNVPIGEVRPAADNVIAIEITNNEESSDLFLDLVKNDTYIFYVAFYILMGCSRVQNVVLV